MAESFPGFNATNWYAFLAPAKTPQPLLDRWNLELVKALNAPEVHDNLLKHGQTTAPGKREELVRFIADEYAKWGRIIQDRKITIE